MATLDWSQCPAVESVPGKRSGAWVFKGTRMPVVTVFENLQDMSVDELMEEFGVTRNRFRLFWNSRRTVLKRRPPARKWSFCSITALRAPSPAISTTATQSRKPAPVGAKNWITASCWPRPQGSRCW